MIHRFGDMFEDDCDITVITTNASKKVNGEIVMGRGAAKRATELYPHIAHDFGMCLPDDRRVPATKDSEIPSYIYPYGFFVTNTINKENLICRMGAFQVKYGWWQQASLELIEISTVLLNTFARDNSTFRINMNYPGIGNGWLKIEDVAPLLETLPDNVNVWRWKKE